jgi:hypothetical protein
VKDAIVSFVEAGDKDSVLAVYKTIATTVSDSQGVFQIALGPLAPTSVYAVRARGASDVWSTRMLGTGASALGKQSLRQTIHALTKADFDRLAGTFKEFGAHVEV